jgi:hypothetical protein
MSSPSSMTSLASRQRPSILLWLTVNCDARQPAPRARRHFGSTTLVVSSPSNAISIASAGQQGLTAPTETLSVGPPTCDKAAALHCLPVHGVG